MWQLFIKLAHKVVADFGVTHDPPAALCAALRAGPRVLRLASEAVIL
jgi:hypothetical protein